MRHGRIGIDIDRKNRFRMLKAYFNALRYGDTEVYDTGKGYHLKIMKESTGQENIQTRHTLGDDPYRIEYDEMKLRLGLGTMIDILFEEKTVWKNGRKTTTREERINPLAEQFWGSRIVWKEVRN